MIGNHSYELFRVPLRGLLVATCCFCAGCATGDRGGSSGFGDLADDGRTLFGDQPSARASGHWTVALAAFRGEGAGELAETALGRATAEGGLSGASLERRGEALVLTYGRFDGPERPEAQRALDRVRGVRIDGLQPFANAVLAPPEPPRGDTPRHDLRNVHRFHGPAYRYTLQVGTYGRADGGAPSPAERRQAMEAAERAVATLRSEGERAFYFHGPNFSSVTVGLFTADDVGEGGRVLAPRYHQLREKFPHNLLNGAPRLVRTPGGGEPVAQRSVLVNIPQGG